MDYLTVFGLITATLLIITKLSYFTSYWTALLLYMWLMPLRNKHKDKWWFKSWAWLPFTIGFLADIYFNIFHFSFQLSEMNRDFMYSGKPKMPPFWPPFREVKGFKTLYKITVTKRLQRILDEYPVESKAYHYATVKARLLNKYDPDHLRVWRTVHVI